jgi:prepilin-type N-terminal cleavage/methylation domain-containing protein
MNRIRAFTIVELLVVITVLAVLLSFLMPVLTDARDVAARLNCASRLRSLGMISLAYTNDYRTAFPLTFRSDRSNSGQPGEAAFSNSSMTALRDYANGDIYGWYCPTIKGNSVDYKTNITLNPTNQPISNLIWGYGKAAGTRGLGIGTPVGLQQKPRYFNTGDNSFQATDPEYGSGAISFWTGYMTTQQMETAPCYQVHLGDMGVWSGATMSRIITYTKPINQGPSKICLWSDAWGGNGVSYSYMSHWTNRYPPNNSYWSDPITTQGRNEVLGDGHVKWYSTATQMDIIYRTWSGQFFTMFVQDDQ